MRTRERGREQRASQPAAAAPNARLPLPLAALAGERRQPDEGRRLPAGHLTKLGHADQQGQRRALADGGHAQDQPEALGQVVVGPHCREEVLDLD